ncbi:RDD family protein [Streptomyces sp. NPDC096205]|uniref:RDD family protein n=1 Tax=Streptomyces sp. NPDC096205 TaxID=3366081 RepID=UPI0038148789
MSAPTPAPGDDRPREGYYPDPSIPGYVRYWNGSAWVPGTSRPAPSDGEPLAPPPGMATPPPAVEETGPHFFDEDPQPEQTPAEPASAWGADRTRQSGFGGEQDRRVSWGAPGADPRVPADAPDADSGNTFVFRRPTAGAEQPPAGPAGGPGVTGSGTSAPGADSPGGGPRFAGGAGGSAAASAGAGSRPGPSDEGTMTFRAVSPRAGAPGFAAGKAAAERAGGQGPSGAAAAPQAGAAPVAPQGNAQAGAAPSGPQSASAPSAPQAGAAPIAPQGNAQAGAAPSGPQSASAPSAPQPTPGVPPQSVGSPQPAPVAAGSPLTTGPGGGQSSWAQQVHRLAAGPGEEQPVAPWKPPVEDIFQAAARRQASARPAGLGKRLAARLIDTVVVAGVTAAAAVPLGTKALDHVQGKIDEAKLSGQTVTVWLLDGTTSAYLGVVLAVLLLTGVLYEALPTAKWGRTLGKRALGLEVRDIEAHEPPAFGAALRRWLVYSVPGLLCFGVIGVLWGLFDRPWRQCWHDKAAHTFVAG